MNGKFFAALVVAIVASVYGSGCSGEDPVEGLVCDRAKMTLGEPCPGGFGFCDSDGSCRTDCPVRACFDAHVETSYGCVYVQRKNGWTCTEEGATGLCDEGVCDHSSVEPDVYDWASCGDLTSYPSVACQIATTGDSLAYSLAIPIGAAVDFIEVTIDPNDNHYNTPEHMPGVILTVIDTTTGDAIEYGPVYDTMTPDYKSPHNLYLFAELVGAGGKAYTVSVTGEHGKYSLNGMKVYAPSVHFAN
jgi:hypothetical protein